MELMIAIFLAYLAGSIPFAKIIASLNGVDIHKTGSGNIGAANVFRNLGWKPGIIVFIADTAKGYLPVLLANNYLNLERDLLLLVGLAAILGHLYPIWLKFKGGKGIATGLGVVLAVSPVLGLFGMLVYVCSFSIYRASAPSSLTAVASLPVFGYFYDREIMPFLLLLTALAFFTHRGNIRNYLLTLNKTHDSIS